VGGPHAFVCGLGRCVCGWCVIPGCILGVAHLISSCRGVMLVGVCAVEWSRVEWLWFSGIILLRGPRSALGFALGSASLDLEM